MIFTLGNNLPSFLLGNNGNKLLFLEYSYIVQIILYEKTNLIRSSKRKMNYFKLFYFNIYFYLEIGSCTYYLLTILILISFFSTGGCWPRGKALWCSVCRGENVSSQSSRINTADIFTPLSGRSIEWKIKCLICVVLLLGT